MTSVVDTSVKHFHSGMLNAPVLNGVAGALIGVLDACLKDGFDLKTATSLVVSGGVATLAYSGTHSATVGSVLLVAGSSLTALNGEQKVTEIGTGVVKFATAQADGTATGTITFKMAPLGWTKAFAGTNLAAYTSSDIESTGMFLRVDDTGTTNARVVGYETMSAISTGTGSFPTPAQMSGGGYWPKSSVANTNPVSWTLFGDGRTFYVHIGAYGGASVGGNLVYNTSGLRGFGDMIVLRPSGDAYSCALGYHDTSDFNNAANRGGFEFGGANAIALPRSYTGLGSAVLTTTYPYSGTATGVSGMDSVFGGFPNPVDGAMLLSRRHVRTSPADGAPRCDVPGIYTVPQSQVLASFTNRDVVPGTGAITGKVLMGVIVGGPGTQVPSPSNVGLAFVDITGPWR